MVTEYDGPTDQPHIMSTSPTEGTDGSPLLSWVRDLVETAKTTLDGMGLDGAAVVSSLVAFGLLALIGLAIASIGGDD